MNVLFAEHQQETVPHMMMLPNLPNPNLYREASGIREETRRVSSGASEVVPTESVLDTDRISVRANTLPREGSFRSNPAANIEEEIEYKINIAQTDTMQQAESKIHTAKTELERKIAEGDDATLAAALETINDARTELQRQIVSGDEASFQRALEALNDAQIALEGKIAEIAEGDQATLQLALEAINTARIALKSTIEEGDEASFQRTLEALNDAQIALENTIEEGGEATLQRALEALNDVQIALKRRIALERKIAEGDNATLATARKEIKEGDLATIASMKIQTVKQGKVMNHMEIKAKCREKDMMERVENMIQNMKEKAVKREQAIAAWNEFLMKRHEALVAAEDVVTKNNAAQTAVDHIPSFTNQYRNHPTRREIFGLADGGNVSADWIAYHTAAILADTAVKAITDINRAIAKAITTARASTQAAERSRDIDHAAGINRNVWANTLTALNAEVTAWTGVENAHTRWEDCANSWRDYANFSRGLDGWETGYQHNRQRMENRSREAINFKTEAVRADQHIRAFNTTQATNVPLETLKTSRAEAFNTFL